MSQTKAQLIDPVDGTIVNADINASAAITGSKISPDFGSQNIVTTGSITGNDLEIGFNSRYLLDIAKQISGAQVKFLLSDKLSPTLIFDDDDKQALYLLMPMHI